MRNLTFASLSLPLRGLLILLIAVVLAVPMTLSPLGTPPASALDLDVGNGSGSGGGGVEGKPPKQESYKPDTPKPGTPNKGGGHSTSGPLISDIEGTGASSTATYVTKDYYTGVVNLKNGKTDARAEKDMIAGLAYAKCKAWVSGTATEATKENIGARVGLRVTTTNVYEFRNGQKSKLLKTSKKYEATSVNCLTLQFSYKTVNCFVDASGSIKMVTPSSSTIKTAQSKTSYGNGNKSYAGCMNSQSVNISINVTISKFGRYEGAAKYRYEQVRVKYPLNANPLTGAWAKPEIIARHGITNSSYNYSYAQLTCRGGTVGKTKAVWSGSWKWDHTDCGPNSGGGSSLYTCTGVNNKAKINGQSTNSATVFRDGEENSLTFPKMGVKGPGAKVHSTKTQVLRSGTPWNTNGTVSARSNDFQLKANGKGSSLFNSNQGTPWMSGNVNSYSFSSVWSSDKGSPTTLRPRYEMDLTLSVPTIQITQWNLTTGNIYFNRTTTPVRAKATCDGQPVTIDVVRSKESG